MNNGGLMARIYVTAQEIEIGTRGRERKIAIVVAKLDKVEILREKSDEVLATVDAGKFPLATAAATTTAAAPAAAEPTRHPGAAAARAEDQKTEMRKKIHCRAEAHHVNRDRDSDEYHQAYDACMARP